MGLELTIPKHMAAFKHKPGISSYSEHPAKVEESLKPIVDQANNFLMHADPRVDVSNVPIYLGATAGMRMLDDASRDEIMYAIRDYFGSSRYPFKFKKEQARVLAGEEEGAFG